MSDPIRAYQPSWAWTGTEWERAPIVGVAGDGTIVDPGDTRVRERPGLLVPGFVNAHTHLEFDWTPTPSRMGLRTWVMALFAGKGACAQAAGRNVHAAIATGTAAVGDISNTCVALEPMQAAGLRGRVFHEFYGIDVEELPPHLSRPTPHAPHTTNPRLVQACAALPGPFSIHFDEDPEEREFLATGAGGWGDFARARGRDMSRFPIPGKSPARYLAELGVLSPRSLLVHVTLTRDADLDLVASTGAPVCLCVRSNQYITGLLPDVPGMVDRGMRIALGTDSLASAPDLDLLAEAAACKAAFPQVDDRVWLRAMTTGGADALDLPLGRLSGRPGLLLIDCPHPDQLLDGTRWPRRWLSCP